VQPEGKIDPHPSKKEHGGSSGGPERARWRNGRGDKGSGENHSGVPSHFLPLGLIRNRGTWVFEKGVFPVLEVTEILSAALGH